MPLQALAHIGDDAFTDLMVGICTELRIEDPDVCRGAVGGQAPILAHDLRSISLASNAAKLFCSTVFGLCPLQEVVPYAVAFAKVEEELDANRLGGEMEGLEIMMIEGGSPVRVGKKAKKEWKSRGREPFKVVHLSDVHIDRSYVVCILLVLAELRTDCV